MKAPIRSWSISARADLRRTFHLSSSNGDDNVEQAN